MTNNSGFSEFIDLSLNTLHIYSLIKSCDFRHDTMGDMMEREKLLDEIFLQYDVYRKGELDTTQLQQIHGDMRLGTISTPQVDLFIFMILTYNYCNVQYGFAH